MLTAERVKGRTWVYSHVVDGENLRAHFEVLEVKTEGELGIFFTRRDKKKFTQEKIDLERLDNLTLDKLDELIQEGYVWEYVPSSSDVAENARENLMIWTYITAFVIFWFGFATFVAGIHVNPGGHQKPWEAVTGAALMAVALLAIAVRRR